MTRVAVVGGGIGGLAAAIALKRAGLEDVEVFERAPEIREVGAALTLWSNALAAMARLGLDARVVAAGREVVSGEFREPSGRVIVATPVGDVARELGFPSVCLLRADLQSILVRAVADAGVPLRLGAECVSVEGLDSTEPRLRFADGRVVAADVVVGSDGLRSVVRTALFGPEPPRYAGYPCWRAIARGAGPREGLAPGTAFETWGPGARFGAIDLGACAYWFASVNAPPNGSDGPDARREILARFGGWHAPIRELVESTPNEAIQRLDILDRPPARQWGAGRVTLLGDAAHPSTPNLGQGGCLALEDAIVLARELRLGAAAPERALRAYEAARRARAARVVRRSRRLGALGQWESATLGRMRNAAMRLVPDRLTRRAFAEILEEGIESLDGAAPPFRESSKTPSPPPASTR